jgi:hypothetical protein
MPSMGGSVRSVLHRCTTPSAFVSLEITTSTLTPCASPQRGPQESAFAFYLHRCRNGWRWAAMAVDVSRLHKEHQTA